MIRALTILIIWLDFYRNLMNVIIMKRFSRFTNISIRSLAFKLFALFLFMNLFAFLKASNYILAYQSPINFYSSIILWLSVVAFCLSILLNAKYSTKYINALIWSSWAYISSVFILFILGVQPSAKIYTSLYGEVGKGLGDASLLQVFGFNMSRVLLPFTTDIGSFAVLSGVSIISILLSYKYIVYSSKSKSYFWKTIRLFPWIFITFASIFNILICDSRTSFYGVLLTLILGYFLTKRFLDKTPIMISCIFLLSPFIGLISDFIQGYAGTLIATRSDGSALSSRDFIWLSALNKLSDFSFEHLFGYGLYGQVVSGVSESYAWLYTGRGASSLLATLHNFSLQLIFDLGYFGLFTFSFLVYLILKKLVEIKKNDKNIPTEIFIYLILYYSIIGITDSSPSIYTFSNLLVFYLIIAISLGLPIEGSNTKKDSNPKTDISHVKIS